MAVAELAFFDSAEGDSEGQKKPPLLLLHGFSGSAAAMSMIAEALAVRYRVICPDLPGHGGSAIDAECSMAAVAAQLLQLLDRLSIARCVLLGYSMGGRLALYLAARHADRLQAVVTIGACAGLPDSDDRRRRRQHDEALAQLLEQRGTTAFVEHWLSLPLFASQRALGAEFIEDQRQLRLNHSAAGLAGCLRSLGLGRQPALAAELVNCHLPILLLAGAEDKKFAAIAESLALQIPRADYRLLTGVGHAAHLEAREEVCASVEDFFDKSEPQQSGLRHAVREWG